MSVEDRLRQSIEKVAAQDDWVHNWMYSFLPCSVDGIGTQFFYLLGYCKNCRRSVVVRLEHGFEPGKAAITQLDVPKYGCVAPS